jgi:hypothetical protein
MLSPCETRDTIGELLAAIEGARVPDADVASGKAGPSPLAGEAR